MAEKYEQILRSLQQMEVEKGNEIESAAKTQTSWLHEAARICMERVRQAGKNASTQSQAAPVQKPSKTAPVRKGRGKRPAPTALETVIEEEEEEASTKDEEIPAQSQPAEASLVKEESQEVQEIPQKQSRSTRSRAKQPAADLAALPPARATRSRVAAKTATLAESFPSPPKTRKTRAKKPKKEESIEASAEPNQVQAQTTIDLAPAKEIALNRTTASPPRTSLTGQQAEIHSWESLRGKRRLDPEEPVLASSMRQETVQDSQQPARAMGEEERHGSDRSEVSDVDVQIAEFQTKDGQRSSDVCLIEDDEEIVAEPEPTCVEEAAPAEAKPADQLFEVRDNKANSPEELHSPQEPRDQSERMAHSREPSGEASGSDPQHVSLGREDPVDPQLHQNALFDCQNTTPGVVAPQNPQAVPALSTPAASSQSPLVSRPAATSAKPATRRQQAAAIQEEDPPSAAVSASENGCTPAAEMPVLSDVVRQSHSKSPSISEPGSPHASAASPVGQLPEHSGLNQTPGLDTEQQPTSTKEAGLLNAEDRGLSQAKAEDSTTISVHDTDGSARLTGPPSQIAASSIDNQQLDPTQRPLEGSALDRNTRGEISAQAGEDQHPQPASLKPNQGPNLVTAHRSLIQAKPQAQTGFQAAKKAAEVDALKAAEAAKRKEAAREAAKQKQKEALTKQKAERAKHALQVKANQEEAQRRAAEEARRREEAAKRKEEEAASRRRMREEAERKEKEEKQRRFEEAKLKKKQEELRKQEEATLKRAREADTKNPARLPLQESNEAKRPKVAEFFAKAAAALVAPAKTAMQVAAPQAEAQQPLQQDAQAAAAAAATEDRKQPFALLAPVPEGIESIEIAPYRSEGETSDEDDDQEIPLWAQGGNLRRQIVAQQRMDPDELFQQHEKTCPLNEVFSDIRGHSFAPGRDLNKRTSTGNWLEDRVTWKEEMNYKKAMGYL